MQRVGDEVLAYPEKATALGPVKVIPRELAGCTCKSIDLQLQRRHLLLQQRPGGPALKLKKAAQHQAIS